MHVTFLTSQFLSFTRVSFYLKSTPIHPPTFSCKIPNAFYVLTWAFLLNTSLIHPPKGPHWSCPLDWVNSHTPHFPFTYLLVLYLTCFHSPLRSGPKHNTDVSAAAALVTSVYETTLASRLRSTHQASVTRGYWKGNFIWLIYEKGGIFQINRTHLL